MPGYNSPDFSWKTGFNKEGGKCASYNCKTQATRYCVVDKNWYCLWCAQQLNAARNGRNADGTVRKACVSRDEATMMALKGEI